MTPNPAFERPGSHAARHWPRRRFRVDGEIPARIFNEQQGIAEASLGLCFGQNTKKTVIGSCDDLLMIRSVDSRPEIAATKSRAVSRNERATGR